MKPTEKEFWDSRDCAGKTPWDFRGVPQALQGYLETDRPGRVLIPGCGAGYEVRAFHEHGWNLLTIVDEPVTDSLPPFAGRKRWQVGETHVSTL